MAGYIESILIDEAMRQILKAAIGKALVKMRAEKPAYGLNDFTGAIGLFFDDGTAIQIENDIVVKQYYDVKEDCGALTVKSINPSEYSSGVVNESIEEYTVSERITDIKIITDHITDRIGDVSYDLTIDIAIVFEMGESVLVFDKGWIFNIESLYVYETNDYMDKLRNAYDDWSNDEDENHPVCKRTVVSLSQ